MGKPLLAAAEPPVVLSYSVLLCVHTVHTHCTSRQIGKGEWVDRFCSASNVTVEKRFTNEDVTPSQKAAIRYSRIPARHLDKLL